MIVYMATNKINGKRYVGQTVFNLNKRKSNHIAASKFGKDSMYFHSALRKYDPENFEWEVLDSARNIDELNKLEIFLIKLFKTFGEGYNLTEGGKNYTASTETKKRMSKAQKGRIVSEETRHKISETLTGVRFSEERVRNMIGARGGEKHPLFGKHRSSETKEKISVGKKGKMCGKDNPSAQPVFINNKYFDTIKAASVFMDVSATTISIKLKKQIPGYEYACKRRI